MTATGFDFERVRLEAAQKLPGEYFDEFQRLTRSLAYGPQFQWLLVDATSEGVRESVIDALNDVLRAAELKVARLPMSGRIPDAAEFERRLVAHARRSDVIHVLGRAGWFDASRWDAINARRERIAAEARARIVFWLDADSIETLSRHAPDLWAWRAGVYDFGTKTIALGRAPVGRAVLEPTGAGLPAADPQTMAQRHRRVAEIRAWLDANPEAPDELLVGPLDELGRLLFSLGELDEALAHWRNVELPLHRRRGDERGIAITQGQIADVLRTRGELDEALRIRREEELPVYERLGDVRARAATMSKIADVLQDRGEIDEALRIHREEALPVYERLGDVRSRAVTMGQIADVLQARGELDEALRIRREEQLPVYERLGDVRERAVTLWKIALHMAMLQPANRETFEPLLQQAHADLVRLGLPEANDLARQMQGLGLTPQAAAPP